MSDPREQIVRDFRGTILAKGDKIAWCRIERAGGGIYEGTVVSFTPQKVHIKLTNEMHSDRTVFPVSLISLEKTKWLK